MSALLIPTLLALSLLVPEAAQACSVCATGTSGESSGVFLAMTAFMTALPFAAVGSLIFFLRRRFKALEAQRETAPSPTASVSTR